MYQMEQITLLVLRGKKSAAELKDTINILKEQLNRELLLYWPE